MARCFVGVCSSSIYVRCSIGKFNWLVAVLSFYLDGPLDRLCRKKSEGQAGRQQWQEGLEIATDPSATAWDSEGEGTNSL